MNIFSKKVIPVVTILSFMGGVLSTHALAEGPGLVLEEIVVTARKKDESFKDVPVTLSVFSEDTLERKRIDNVDGLLTKTPSLFVTQNQTFGPVKSETYITLRGVGATTPLEPAVSQSPVNPSWLQVSQLIACSIAGRLSLHMILVVPGSADRAPASCTGIRCRSLAPSAQALSAR